MWDTLRVYRISEQPLKTENREYIGGMSLPSAWDEMTVDDFPEGGLRLLAEEMGPATASRVWRCLQGTRLEVRSRFTDGYMLRYVRAHWNGHNENQIARALGCTARHVRNLAGVVPAKKAPAPLPQLSMF